MLVCVRDLFVCKCVKRSEWRLIIVLERKVQMVTCLINFKLFRQYYIQIIIHKASQNKYVSNKINLNVMLVFLCGNNSEGIC